MCRSSSDNHCVSHWHNTLLCFQMHSLDKRLLISPWGWEKVFTPFLSICGLCWWCPSIDKFLMHACLQSTPPPFQKWTLANSLECINSHTNLLCSDIEFLFLSRIARKLNWITLGSEHAQFVPITTHQRASSSAEHRLEPVEVSYPQLLPHGLQGDIHNLNDPNCTAWRVPQALETRPALWFASSLTEAPFRESAINYCLHTVAHCHCSCMLPASQTWATT